MNTTNPLPNPAGAIQLGEVRLDRVDGEYREFVGAARVVDLPADPDRDLVVRVIGEQHFGDVKIWRAIQLSSEDPTILNTDQARQLAGALIAACDEIDSDEECDTIRLARSLLDSLTDEMLDALSDDDIDNDAQRDDDLESGEEETNKMTEPHNSAPADLACLTLEDRRIGDHRRDEVFVMIGGVEVCEQHGRHEFITVGVRDSHTDAAAMAALTRGDDAVRSEDFKTRIDVYPRDAIRLARFLLDYATDMLDAPDDDEESVDTG
jgi:hypothetical protein